MFNNLDWLIPDTHAICILFDEPGTPVIVFRTGELAIKHADGVELIPGDDFIIIGGFSDAIHALTFANSHIIHAIHVSVWGE
jgi:hypothetical protein